MRLNRCRYNLKQKFNRLNLNLLQLYLFVVFFWFFKQRYLYSHSIKANKIYGITNYSLRSLFINNKEVTIDCNSYKNREREKFDNPKTNMWTETRPLYIDNLTRSILVYVPKYIIKFKNDSVSKT
jgi:hypothetical protein